MLLKVGDVGLIRVSSGGDTPTIKVAALPLRFGTWEGSELAVTPQAVAPLARDAVVQRTYRRADHEGVMVSLIYSNKWEGLHPPEHCLVAGGWKIGRETTVDLTYGADRRSARGNIVTAFKPPKGSLVELYIFADASKTTSTWIQQYTDLLTRHGRSGGQASCLLLVAYESHGETDPARPIAVVQQFAQDFLPYVHQSLQP